MDSQFIIENIKTAIAGEYDVIVAGGGPAGIGAAISSARAGNKTLLIERYGFLGGTWTAGINSFIPIVQDESKGGIVKELIERLQKQNAWGGWIDRGFDSEVMKITLDRMMFENSVDLLFHSYCVNVIHEDSYVKGVIVENKSGRNAYLAKVIIDCTGDGDICAKAGAAYEIGRKSDGLMQPMTLMFKLSNIDFSQQSKEHLLNLIKEAMQRGNVDYQINYLHPYILMVPGTRKAICQMTHIRKKSAINALELTQAEIEGRELVKAAFEIFKKEIPQFKDVELEQTGPQIGIRESRRIIGEYILGEEDLIAGRHFDDGVVNCFNAIDIHEPDGLGMYFVPVKPYQIPYRCLVPIKVENVLVAGRCISGTHEALAAYRMTGICVAMGQVAGNAAGIAIKDGTTVRNINFEKLREQLTNQGVLT